MLPLGNIIRKFGISFHCYADDTQLYISTRPDETSKLSKLTECVKNIKDWMTSNFLLLNSDKTEILIIGPKNSTQNLLDYNLQLDGCNVTSSTVKNLGVILDSNLSFEIHISNVTKTALNDLAPAYLTNLLSRYNPTRSLRSQNSGLLVVPRIAKSTKGGRTFSYLAPKLCNSLPDNVQTHSLCLNLD